MSLTIESLELILNFKQCWSISEFLEKWLAVDDFLSEMATTVFAPHEEQNKYKITNSMGRFLLKIPSVHGLNYPSVATRLASLNLCLRPEVADQLFYPAEAWMIKIEVEKKRPDGLNQDGPFYRTTFIRKSEEIKGDGRIVWSDLLVNVTPEQIVHLDYRTRLPSEIEQQFKRAAYLGTARMHKDGVPGDQKP